jgi:hypothetical protein
MVCNESLQRCVMKYIVVRWYVMNHYNVCDEIHSGTMVRNESLQRYVMKYKVVQWYVMNHCNGM